MQFDQNNVLFRNIVRIFSLEKQCYLENRVVREPCKQRTACTHTMGPTNTTISQRVNKMKFIKPMRD